MQADMNARMFFEMFEEREVAIDVRSFENVLEIAAGLMGVNEQGEVKGLGHRNNRSL